MDCYVFEICSLGDRLSDKQIELIQKNLAALISGDSYLSRYLDVRTPADIQVEHSLED